MKEEWKDIKDYEGLYQVSNLGNVKSLNYNRTGKPKLLKLAEDYDGYLLVSLSKNGKHITTKVHRLVANAFLGKNTLQINHKNENKKDNRLINLEYCTAKYNKRYSEAKSVLQFDLNGNIIKEWSCIRDVEECLNINHSNLISCCKGRHYKTVGGYIWKYKEEC